MFLKNHRDVFSGTSRCFSKNMHVFSGDHWRVSYALQMSLLQSNGSIHFFIRFFGKFTRLLTSPAQDSNCKKHPSAGYNPAKFLSNQSNRLFSQFFIY